MSAIIGATVLGESGDDPLSGGRTRPFVGE
jgi:hypothetical protein